MSIIERVYLELERQGLKASALCEYIGVSTGQLSTWKKRDTDPKAIYIPKIAEFLGKSQNYIITGESDKEIHTIGERIRELRKRQGLTQDELALRLDTTKQTVHKYENGIIRNIPSNKVAQLAKALNSTPQYIMGWEDWTEEEFEEIERFKAFVLANRKK